MLSDFGPRPALVSWEHAFAGDHTEFHVQSVTEGEARGSSKSPRSSIRIICACSGEVAQRAVCGRQAGVLPWPHNRPLRSQSLVSCKERSEENAFTPPPDRWRVHFSLGAVPGLIWMTSKNDMRSGQCPLRISFFGFYPPSPNLGKGVGGIGLRGH